MNELEFDTDEPSRLTVISDAALTEVYVLEKSLIHIIPFPLKVILISEWIEIENVNRWDSTEIGIRLVLRLGGDWESEEMGHL